MLDKIYKILLKEYGKQGWWPITTADSHPYPVYGADVKNDEQRFEVVVDTILTQNTAWKNVEKALVNLNNAGLLDKKKLAAARQDTIAKLIRPAGYYNQKSERLKMITNFFLENKDFFDLDISEMRDVLLGLKGIGPETADSIILYAAQKPIFVVDAYTRRIFSRAGLVRKDAAYDEVQEYFMEHLPHNTKMFNEYHALIVELAKQHCKVKPVCDNCPLNKICKKKI